MYYIYGQSGPSLLIESTDSMIIIYVCIINHCYAEAHRSSKELGYKEKGDSQNSLECSISTFVCVILINFHVFMMKFC